MLTNPRDALRGQSMSPNIPYARYTFLLMYNSNFYLFPIFNFKKCRNLEIRVRRHSRLLNVIPFDRLGMVSYWCFIETLCIFQIFDFKNAVTL